MTEKETETERQSTEEEEPRIEGVTTMFKGKYIIKCNCNVDISSSSSII